MLSGSLVVILFDTTSPRLFGASGERRTITRADTTQHHYSSIFGGRSRLGGVLGVETSSTHHKSYTIRGIHANVEEYTQVYANIHKMHVPAGYPLMGAPQPLSLYGIYLLIANYCPPGMLNICSPPGIIELCRAECPVHYSTHLTSTRLSTPRYDSSGRIHFGSLWAQPGNGQSGHIVQNEQERR